MRRALTALVLAALLALAITASARAYDVNQAYTRALASLDRLRPLASTDVAALSPESLAQIQSNLAQAHADFVRLESVTAADFADPVARALPWLGPRYRAARDLTEIGILATDAGSTVVTAAAELLPALDRGGFAASATGAPSWLDVLQRHREGLNNAARDMETIRALRADFDAEVLPERLRSRLAELDRMLARSEFQVLTNLDLAAVTDALGGADIARYLVLLQNPAELRATGGFPGTMALLTLERGRLQSYEFFDAHELTQDYMAHRPSKLAQPWPLQQFAPQDGFLLHDAAWWADFPRSARQLMDMYAESGWPPIDGVVAMQPELASDLVRVIGPFGVDFNGEKRAITADNVFEQIDGERRLTRRTPEDRIIHKAFLGVIGKTIIERLKNTDRASLGKVVNMLGARCQTRDLQVYAANPSVEAELDRHGCTGRLQPRPDEATLAVTYANLALAKTSLDMRPTLTLTADPPRGGRREVRLNIDLRDGAIADEDPIYQGFQRWWVEVNLPEGSTLLSDRGAMEDPQSPNGGSYLAAIFPDQTGEINVVFSMPDVPVLLVRRQPGVRPGDVHLSQRGCGSRYSAELDRDLTLDFAALC